MYTKNDPDICIKQNATVNYSKKTLFFTYLVEQILLKFRNDFRKHKFDDKMI